jgi:hypothetical protein
MLVLAQNYPSHTSYTSHISTVGAGLADPSTVSANPVPTKPALLYSQHSGGGRAGSIETFIDGSHDILAKPAPTETFTHQGIPEMIRGFKTFSAYYINEKCRTQSCPVWQRNYYEPIIRNNPSLQIDQLHPNNPSKC